LFFFLNDAAAIPADFFYLDGEGVINMFNSNDFEEVFFKG
jgi:hypothetical protein